MVYGIDGLSSKEGTLFGICLARLAKSLLHNLNNGYLKSLEAKSFFYMSITLHETLNSLRYIWAMKAYLESEMEQAIEQVMKKSDEGVIILGESDILQEGVFLNAYTVLLERFKLPDYPFSGGNNDLLKYLGISDRLNAIWDFDYYKLSLVLMSSGEVVLTKHSP